MHRRRYIPHSDVKVSRRAMLHDRKNLVAKIEDAKATAAAERRARENAEQQTVTAKVRGFLKKTRQFFTQPVKLGKRGAAA